MGGQGEKSSKLKVTVFALDDGICSEFDVGGGLALAECGSIIRLAQWNWKDND